MNHEADFGDMGELLLNPACKTGDRLVRNQLVLGDINRPFPLFRAAFHPFDKPVGKIFVPDLRRHVRLLHQQFEPFPAIHARLSVRSPPPTNGQR